MRTPDEELMAHCLAVIERFQARIRSAQQEWEDPDHIPVLRVVDVETLADDPKYGDLPGVADALRRRLAEKA